MEGEIIQRIDSLEKKVDLLIEEVRRLNTSCSRMDSHISFVETTYETLKNPLNMIKSAFSRGSYQEIKND